MNFFIYMVIWGVICFVVSILLSSCQVPEKLKDDPALYEEARKSREHNIKEVGKVYRNQSGKIIEKAEKRLEKMLDE